MHPITAAHEETVNFEVATFTCAGIHTSSCDIFYRRCLQSRWIFGHWKAVTAIFLTLTLIRGVKLDFFSITDHRHVIIGYKPIIGTRVTAAVADNFKDADRLSILDSRSWLAATHSHQRPRRQPAPADQRLKTPALHAVNNRKLVPAEFTAATRQS